jgi:hypothetical protein
MRSISPSRWTASRSVRRQERFATTANQLGGWKWKLQNISKLRLALTKPGPARIREIAVYESKDAMVGAGVKGKEQPTAAVDRTKHQIAVNQVGYETGKPKRFTAPLSPDGTRFYLRAANDAKILHQGEIRGGVGDFSAFRPADSTNRYVIEVRGGALKDGASDPFLIRGNLFQEQFWQAAVDFLNDSRSVVGTHPSAYGGCPWRDGTYYDAIIPSLVLFYLADQKPLMRCRGRLIGRRRRRGC